MSILKRIIVAIKRNANRSLLMFLIVVVLSLFIGIIFDITNQFVYLDKEIKAGLDTTDICIEYDLESNQDYDRPYADLEKINDSYYELHNELMNSGMVDEKSAIYIESELLSHKYLQKNSSSYNGKLSVHGFISEDLDNLLFNKTISIEDGQMITEEEATNGDNVIMVRDGYLSYDEDEANSKIKVGDEITFYIDYAEGQGFGKRNDESEYYKEYTFKVVGTYDLNNSGNTYPIGWGFDVVIIPKNTYFKVIEDYKDYLKDNGAESLIEEYGLDYYAHQYKASYYEAKDPSNLEDILATIELSDFNVDNDFTIRHSGEDYLQIKNALDDLSMTANIIMIVGIVILSVVLYFSIYFYLNERKYDVGVLLSMGQSKISLTIQFILELLFISLTAIVLADVVLYLFAEKFIRLFMPMTVRLYYKMSFEVGISDLAMWSLLVLGIVVIVSLIPLIKTIRTKPRKLLM